MILNKRGIKYSRLDDWPHPRGTPQTGKATGWIGLKGLLSPERPYTPKDWQREHDGLNAILGRVRKLFSNYFSNYSLLRLF